LKLNFEGFKYPYYFRDFMRLYDFKRNIVNATPKKVFRGLDIYKDNSDGISQIENILKNENIPSSALLISQGRFDFERMNKNASSKNNLNKEIQKYVNMIKKEALDPLDIDENLRYNHWLHLPSPLVSVSSSIMTGARYSHFVLRPILVYKTDNLEGIDFRSEPQDNDNEIGIFKLLPTENLTDIIYFYEDSRKINELLKDYKRRDVKIDRGFLRPDFKYRTLSGEEHFSVPSNLMYDKDFQEFYKNKEELLIGI
jgi:hypothetical protein